MSVYVYDRKLLFNKPFNKYIHDIYGTTDVPFYATRTGNILSNIGTERMDVTQMVATSLDYKIKDIKPPEGMSLTIQNAPIQQTSVDIILNTIGGMEVENVLTTVNKLGKNDLNSLLTKLSFKYYHTDRPIVSDNVWDSILAVYETKFGKRTEIGAVLPATLEKIQTPYHMGSLNKIKTEREIGGWKQNKFVNPSNYVDGIYAVIMDKLDGVSVMYFNRDGKHFLVKHSSGKGGTDISHFIPFLRLPSLPTNEAVRGELIVKKSVFELKYSKSYENPLSMVSGISIAKEWSPEVVSDLDFVVYERYSTNVIYDQLNWLHNHGFDVVNYTVLDTPYHLETELTEEKLTDRVVLRRELSEYNIDGIVIAENISIPPITSGNPTHKIAFKIDGETAISAVIKVEWNLSEYRKFKPRVNISPVRIGGKTISWVTGNNAKFIKEKNIGPGAEVVIIRSGEVIPKIVDVIKPSRPSFPEAQYVWDAHGVDILLPEGTESERVNIKQIISFFKELDIKFLATKTIEKLYGAGFTTLAQFLTLTVDKIISSKIEGLMEGSAKRIVTNIQQGIQNVELALVMSASGIFGYGFGHRRTSKIVQFYPDILTFVDKYTTEQIEELIGKIGQFKKLAKQFAIRLPLFIQFLENHPQITIRKRDVERESIRGDKAESQVGGLKGINVVFTGYRNSTLEKMITESGGNVQPAVTKQTTHVIVKNVGEEEKLTGKTKKAIEYGIPIMAEEEFVQQFLREISTAVSDNNSSAVVEKRKRVMEFVDEEDTKVANDIDKADEEFEKDVRQEVRRVIDIDNNKLIVSILNQMSVKEKAKGEKYRAIAYTKASKAIKAYNGVITSGKQARAEIKGIGERIAQKIDEILATGKLQKLEEYGKDPEIVAINELSRIAGIGPVKAKMLYKEHNIRNLDDLRQNEQLLTYQQKMGLKYLSDLEQRIPRAEIELIELVMKKLAENVDKNIQLIIAGSFRRGEPTSGDVDTLVSVKNWKDGSTPNILKKFIDTIEKSLFAKARINYGEKKYTAYVQLSNNLLKELNVGGIRGETYLVRHLDIRFFPQPELPFGLFYFTGNDMFNIRLRLLAESKGMKLNEFALTNVNDGSKIPASSEEEILKILGLGYIEPKDRK